MSDVSVSDNEEDFVEEEEEDVDNGDDFEGPYRERLMLTSQFMQSHDLFPDEVEAGVNQYYEYVDMVYDMFFKKNMNPYTGQPYVLNPYIHPYNRIKFIGLHFTSWSI